MSSDALQGGGVGVPATPLPCAGDPPRVCRIMHGAYDVVMRRRGRDPGDDEADTIARVVAGQVFVLADMPSGQRDLEIWFMPTPGTRIEVLDAPSCGQVTAEQIGPSVDAWLISAATGLPPSSYVALCGAEVELRSGEAGAVASGAAWVEVIEGEAEFAGARACTFGAGKWLLLSQNSWLLARSDLRLRISHTALAPAGCPVPVALASVQTALLAACTARVTAERARFVERVEARRAAAGGLMSAALGKLDDIVDPARRDDDAVAFDSGPEGIYRLVLEASGIAMPDLPIDFAAADAGERVTMLAAIAQVQKRRVMLAGRWWLGDAGPMLGQLAGNGEPVAILRGKSGGYRVFPAGAGRPVAVDEEVAATLCPHAFTFFRALPSRPLSIGDLLQFGLHGRRREIGSIAVLGTILALLGLLVPIALGNLFDRVIPEADRLQLVQMTAILIGAAAATFFLTLVRSEVLLRLQTIVEGSLQAAVWDRVLKLPVAFFRDYTAGDLANRINSINEIHQQLSGAVLGSLVTALFSMVNFFLLFYYSASLAAVALAIVLIAVLGEAAVLLLVLRYERLTAGLRGKLAGHVLQYLLGVAKLRVAAAEPRAFSRWAGEYGALRGFDIRTQTLRNYSAVGLASFFALANVVLFYQVANLSLQSTATGVSSFSAGDFVAFITAFTAFTLSFHELSGMLLSLLRVVPLLERARPILQGLPEIEPRRARAPTLQGGIEVSNVVFRYRPDGPVVLDGVSFKARPGEFVAIVGPSGSGKSSLMRLLLGFEAPEAGSVFMDGRNLADLDLRSVRKQMGVVLQASQLMPGDIYSNIVGAHLLTLDDAWSAARACGLDQDIEAMPMGMHTVIGEGASTLSGGQRQRILIARAVARKPRMLLLDEATSALDNRSQAVVGESLGRMKATRIVIAHRLSTIVNADRILVLDRGRVVQSGTYAQLISQPGLFCELAQRQLG